MFESSSSSESDEAWLGFEADYLTGAELVAWVRVQPAGPGLLHDLSCVDPAALSPDEAVTYLQTVERLVAHVAGFQAQARAAVTAALVAHEEAEAARRAEEARLANEERVAAGLAPRRSGAGFVVPEMAVHAELAAALRLSPRSVSSQLQYAVDLAGPWRPLRDALLAGEISDGHAKAIGRVLALLPAYLDPEQVMAYASQCAKVLDVVIPYARTHTPGECAKRARDLITTVDPAGTKTRRREVAESEHGVFLGEREPGTCVFTAVLPTAHAAALYRTVDALAHHDQFQVADGCVAMGQRRTAALCSLVLGDPGQTVVIDGPVAEAKLAAHVDVIVSLDTLLGTSDQPGRVDGAPVPADVIRDLLADADPTSTLRRLVTDAAGCVLDYGRTRYLATGLQRRLIQLRDGRCQFPGCPVPAHRCQIDHAHSWDTGGTTDLCNLGCLCDYHHQLKTHHHWRITHHARDGSCTWRSPLGRIYERTPRPLLPPARVPHVVDTGPPPPF